MDSNTAKEIKRDEMTFAQKDKNFEYVDQHSLWFTAFNNKSYTNDASAALVPADF